MTATRPTELMPSTAAALLHAPASGIRIAPATGGNRTWRVEHEGGAFYIKCHTRSWYDWDPLQAAVIAVRHEASAYRLLADAGLAAPQLIAVFDSPDNPLNWPCLILRALSGHPLPVAAVSDGGPALRVAGAYLAAMHSITFEHAGYLLDGPPAAPPDPDRYQHPNWTVERFLATAFSTWALDSEHTGDQLVDRAARLLLEVAPRLSTAFQPARFIVNDCHAGQVFIDMTGAHPSVTGVVDMEVASAGTPLADLFKLTVELAGSLPPSLRWWDHLFDGYGTAPDLDVFRLYAAAQAHINYICHGPNSWPGTRRQILGHLLDATSWEELFDLSRLRDGNNNVGLASRL
jgi:Ser/Thr protein kinase RdoA (MazF antagonist)